MKAHHPTRKRLCALLALISLPAIPCVHAADGIWAVDADGNWSDTANWTGGIVADGTGFTATFDGISANRIVTLDSNRTIGNVSFDDFSHHLEITGSTLTFDTVSGTPTIDVADEELTFATTIDGNDGLSKTGNGILHLDAANTFSGGTTIGGGAVRVTSDGNLGAADSAITFDSTATLWNDQGGNTTIDLGARPIALNNNALASFLLGRGDGFTTTGDVTGDGGVAIQVSGGNSPKIFLLGTNNTFTGPVEIRSGSDRPYVTVNSLADGAGAITLNNGEGHFVYSSGAAGALTLNNRPIIVESGGYIDNLSSFPMTINSSVTGSGAGSATLRLSGGQGGTISADIDEDTRTLGLAVSNTWTLSGTNTINGTTTLNNGGTLQVLGTQAMPSGQIQMYRNSTLRLRTDDAGTVNLGNDLVARRIDTSTGIIQNYTIDVANNGGATTDSTIVFGKMDFTVGDVRPPRQFNTEGANGYRVQVGDVVLETELQGTATGGAQRIRGNSAPLEITGTVKQLDGNSGTRPNSSVLFLGGTGTGNVVSGAIADADDYPANSNALPLSLYKGDAGEWTLSGTNSQTGTTTVVAGTLLINGDSSAATGDVTVDNAMLGGTGTVGAKITIGPSGIFAPGASIGTFTTTGDATINGTLEVEVDGSSVDLLAVGGDLTLGGSSILSVVETGSDAMQSSYTVATFGGALTGTFATTAGFPAGYAVAYPGDAGGAPGEIRLIGPGGGGSAFDAWATSNGVPTGSEATDADSGSLNNLGEFGLGGDPLDANDDGSLLHAFSDEVVGGGAEEGILTILVRSGTTFASAGAPAVSGANDGIVYSVAGGTSLPVDGAATVTPMGSPVTTGLDPAPAGYEYASFYVSGPEAYFQVTVAPE